MQEPVLHWLSQRAKYVEHTNDLEWVLQDPIVSCLLPVLYVLDKQERINLSERVYEAVKNIYLSNKARWIMREHRLKQILNVLYRADIEVIPLKGAILQDLLYQDNGVRGMSDIDILVRPEEYLYSAKLLTQQCGLMLSPSNRFDNLSQLEKLPEKYWPGELSFFDSQGFAIDLHRNLVPSQWFNTAYGLEISAVWERCVNLSDVELKTTASEKGLWNLMLSPYDMLAHLCLNSALHGLQIMRNYLDVDLWIRKLPLSWDWSQFIEIANQWQIRSVVFHVISFCREFMGTPVSNDVLKQIDPGWLARWRVRQLISPQILMADRTSLGKRYPTLVRIALVDHLSKMFLTIIKMTFPDKLLFTRHPTKQGIIGHWLHVFEVIKRGD